MQACGDDSADGTWALHLVLAQIDFGVVLAKLECAATYALALYLQGDVEKASKLLSGFPRAELEAPQIAAYYGVILAGSGDFPRATKFLDLGAKANLLREERKLIGKAQRTIARR